MSTTATTDAVAMLIGLTGGQATPGRAEFAALLMEAEPDAEFLIVLPRKAGVAATGLRQMFGSLFTQYSPWSGAVIADHKVHVTFAADPRGSERFQGLNLSGVYIWWDSRATAADPDFWEHLHMSLRVEPMLLIEERAL